MGAIPSAKRYTVADWCNALTFAPLTLFHTQHSVKLMGKLDADLTPWLRPPESEATPASSSTLGTEFINSVAADAHQLQVCVWCVGISLLARSPVGTHLFLAHRRFARPPRRVQSCATRPQTWLCASTRPSKTVAWCTPLQLAKALQWQAAWPRLCQALASQHGCVGQRNAHGIMCVLTPAVHLSVCTRCGVGAW